MSAFSPKGASTFAIATILIICVIVLCVAEWILLNHFVGNK